MFSMVVNDFDIEGVAALETETQPPLVIDADAPLTDAAAFQRFESMGRREPQVVDLGAAARRLSRIIARCRISGGKRFD